MLTHQVSWYRAHNDDSNGSNVPKYIQSADEQSGTSQRQFSGARLAWEKNQSLLPRRPKQKKARNTLVILKNRHYCACAKKALAR